MPDATAELIREYGRRYTAYDVEGVVDLCHWPFVTIDDGVATHLRDRDAIRDHVQETIHAYRWLGAISWTPVEIDPYPLGETTRFATVRWQALDDSGNVVHDSRTIYHLIDSPEDAGGPRILSCTTR
jgi:hypothetical protein